MRSKGRGAVAFDPAREVESHQRTEEVAVVGKHEGRYVALRGEAECAAIVGRGGQRAPGQAGGTVCHQQERGAVVVDGAGPRDLGAQRRATGQARKGGEDAVGLFLDVEDEGEDAGSVAEGGDQGQGACLPSVRFAVRFVFTAPLASATLPATVNATSCPMTGAASLSVPISSAPMLTATGRLGGRRGSLRRWGGVVADRRAQDGDRFGREFAHLEPAGQKRGAVPVHREVFGPEPDSFGIGDGQRVHRGGRGQRAAEAGDPHIGTGARKGGFDLAGDEARVALACCAGWQEAGRGKP